jgi:hypothetical protein
MKQNVSPYDFRDAFAWHGKEDNFSKEGLDLLYDHLIDLEENTGIETELDVIAICRAFTEYRNLKEFQDNYGEQYRAIKDIEEVTRVIRINDDAFIVQNF